MSLAVHGKEVSASGNERQAGVGNFATILPTTYGYRPFLSLCPVAQDQ